MRTEMRDEKEIKREKKIVAARVGQRIAILLAILFVIACIYFMRGNIAQWYSKLKATQQSDLSMESTVYNRIKFEPDDNNIFALCGSNLAVLNKSTFRMYAPDDEEIQTINVGFSNPGMTVAGNKAILYNRGAKDIIIADSSDLIAKMETGGNITALYANERGYMAVIEEDELYRACVNVYNNNQKLVYQWKTSDYYIITAAVSPDNDTLMVIGYTQNEGEFISRLIFFDINEGKYLATADINGTVITNAYFIGKDTVSLIGDNSAYIYSTDCEKLYDYNYGNDTLRAGAAGDRFTIVTLTDRTTGLGSKLVLLDAKTQKASTIYTADDVRAIAVSEDYIALLYTQSVQLFDLELNERSDEVSVSQVKDILVNDSGLVMLIYSTDAGYVDLLSAFSKTGGGNK